MCISLNFEIKTTITLLIYNPTLNMPKILYSRETFILLLSSPAISSSAVLALHSSNNEEGREEICTDKSRLPIKID
jgi:hypothetical protein